MRGTVVNRFTKSIFSHPTVGTQVRSLTSLQHAGLGVKKLPLSCLYPSCALSQQYPIINKKKSPSSQVIQREVSTFSRLIPLPPTTGVLFLNAYHNPITQRRTYHSLPTPIPSFFFPKRFLATTRGRKSKFSWSNKTPYELLNIPTTATEKEIKLAYFREAKKCHPDLNPNDPEAKEKFQAIAAAYELLSDPVRRANYDTTGFTGQQNTQSNTNYQENTQYYGQQTNYGGYGQQHAEDVFRNVQNDVDVIKEALVLLKEEWRDEFNLFVDAFHRQDYAQLWEIAKEHRLLISSIIVPTFLLVRYPPAVFAVLRLLMAGLNVGVAFLVYTGNLQVAANIIWRQIVRLSVEQKKIVEEKRKRK